MSDTATTFRVGDRVRVASSVYGGECATSGEGVISAVGARGYRAPYRVQLADGQILSYLADELTPLAEPQNGTQSDARPTDGQSLQSAEIQALKAQIHAMQDDVATIGEHLKRTAERHEWCDEYEEHLSRLVADLSEHSAKTLHDAAKRVQTYSVTYSFTQEVEACDEAQARRIIEHRYELPFAGNWRMEEV